MTVLILNRGPLSLRPYPEWLHDYPDGLLLLASEASLRAEGVSLPAAGEHYLHTESVPGYEQGAELWERAVRLHEQFGYQHLIACQERDLVIAGALRDHLGLAGQSEASARAFRDKLEMKRQAAAGGIPVAAHAPIGTPDELRDFAARHGFPLVVKPRDSSGSRGQQTLRSEAELAAFLADQAAWQAAQGDIGMLAEEFVEGAMYHVDGVVVGGNLAAAWPSTYLYRLADFHGEHRPRLDVALDRDDPLGHRLMAALEQLLAVMPTPTDTTFHAEFFHTPDDRLVLCEVASRNAGALVPIMLRLMYGVHFPAIWVRAQVGLPVPVPTDGSRVLPNQLAGEVTILKRRGLVRALPEQQPPFPWVGRYDLRMSVGEWSPGPEASADYLAGFAVGGADRAEVESRLRQLSEWFLAGLEVDADYLPAAAGLDGSAQGVSCTTAPA